jgi:two-component system, OmpR family, sensor kinase
VSLRARLLAITLALLAAGLATAGWATHRYLEGFLVDRVDRELAHATTPALRELNGSPADAPVDPIRPAAGGEVIEAALPAGGIAELRGANGKLLASLVVDADGSATVPPRLPADLPSGYSEASVAGVGDMRVLATDVGSVELRGGRKGTLVMAAPLEDVQATLGRLVWIELAVGAATLAALGALGLWLVRLGFRPLARIEQTAKAIAEGDLAQRVPTSNPHTEVGRLAGALNAMLAKIEAAFEERRASEQRLRRFVADASHELQTPLTSVRGYAELFRRGAAQRPEDLATAMSRIEAEARRMGVLVDDLLLLARLDEGRPLAREPVDLAALARELVGDARALEPDRPFALEADGPVTVPGDDVALRQVLANLLSNVRRHTPPGAPATVRVSRQDGQVVLEVADRGPGLAPEDAARVFERFFRADPSRARVSGGSGLGLAIVGAIAAAHGGQAEVDSAPGQGTTFRVVLPAAPRAGTEAAESSADAQVPPNGR